MSAMPDNDLMTNLRDGRLSRNIRMVAARGLLPVSADQMLLLLVHLARDPDDELARTASGTLNDWSEADVVSQLQSEACADEIFQHYSASSAPAVQEAIIMNPKTPGAVIASLASRVPAALLEMVLYNHTRLLEFPQILPGIKSNPAATPQIIGQLLEIETEFFGEKKQEYTVEETVEETVTPEAALTLETEPPPDDLWLEGLPVDSQEREAAILSRLSSMTVQQKLKLALAGTREARAVLVRDTNKEIARAVLQSPKLTIQEIESFASIRNISDEILRIIAASRKWTKSYVVVLNLVKNPKTPPMISQRMIPRLIPKDLINLARDRSLPELVRKSAERMVKQRSAKGPIG